MGYEKKDQSDGYLIYKNEDYAVCLFRVCVCVCMYKHYMLIISLSLLLLHIKVSVVTNFYNLVLTVQNIWGVGMCVELTRKGINISSRCS